MYIRSTVKVDEVFLNGGSIIGSGQNWHDVKTDGMCTQCMLYKCRKTRTNGFFGNMEFTIYVSSNFILFNLI